MSESQVPAELFEPGPGKLLVLGELGLNGKDNEVLLVTCRVVRFTTESKAKAGEYQNDVRGYVEVEPENLSIHIPVLNPASLVDENGDADLAAYVYRVVARALDMSVVKIASERADRAVAQADVERAIAARRAEVRPVRREVAGAEAL